MQLPFMVVVEGPSRAELGRLVRAWWIWAIVGILIAAGAAGTFAFYRQQQLGAEVVAATLQVSSVPDSVTVTVDGRVRGRTPTKLQLPPGEHQVTVRDEHSIEATYRVRLEAGQSAHVAAKLWLRSPRVQRLRPPFPGASIVGADFLSDGRVALAVALPPGDERQLWLVDADGGMRRLGPPFAHGSLAPSPDGEQAAYIASSQHPGASTRLDELWLAQRDGGRGERLYVLPASAADERLVDLGWAPDGQHLLLASRQQLPEGGERTHLRWLPARGGEEQELATLPSEVVPGSYDWSPDGEYVALLSRAGQLTSLCVLGTRDGTFHYLADLGRDDGSPLAFAPLTWSPDGQRLLYAAPVEDHQVAGRWLFGPKTTIGLFAADIAHPIGQRLGSAGSQFPVWRSDGTVLVLARASGGRLVLRQVDPGGEGREPSARSGETPAELSLAAPSRFAVRWDVAHAQALIILPGSAGIGPSQPEYWLVRFRPEVGK